MLTDQETFIRLLLSVLLSGIIGFERERHGRAAGLRTHMLVGLGSALMMLTGMHLFDVYQQSVTLDPTRLGAQVISGIGFLGAGTIFRARASIHGLTTAASLWAVAGVGLAVGSGFYAGALMTTALVWMALFVLPRMFGKVGNHQEERTR